ncbi:DUF3363 domain-containing protein [Sphingomonas oryzagri]
MTRSFDLIVIGVGLAAVAAAEKCAAAGWSVAVVDELPYGGTWALRGCDPKKLLRRGAEVINNARLMRGKGVEDDSASINWRELVAFKRSFTDRVPDRIEGADVASGRFAVIERSRDFTLVPWRQVLEARAEKPVPASCGIAV